VTPPGEDGLTGRAPVVRLALPASPEYIRLARLVVAGLATRAGFSYDDVEDLRIAVDELCFLMVGPTGLDGEVALTFTVRDDALEVNGRGRAAVGELSPFSKRIVAAVTDWHEIQSDDGDVMFRFARSRREIGAAR
jgi:serine/threonine-protein kinase RsbW